MLLAQSLQHHKEQTLSLWESLCAITPSILQQSHPVLSFIGGGGKTSWIYALAQELASRGKRVLIMTTTKMYQPRQWGVIDGSVMDIVTQLQHDGIAVVGQAVGTEKIGYIGDTLWQKIKNLADIILVEADGARRKPMKILGSHEPVILQETTAICAVIGLTALRQTLDTVCFRWQETGLPGNTLVTPDVFMKLWQEGNLTIVKQRYPHVPLIPIIHQADTKDLACLSKHLLQQLRCDGIVSTFPPSFRDQGRLL